MFYRRKTLNSVSDRIPITEFVLTSGQCYLWLYFPNCDLVYFHESKFVNLRSNIFNNIWQPLTWYKSKTFDICQTLKLNRLNTPLSVFFRKRPVIN